jgi:uncharacterized protein (TIGR00369 family)
MTDLQWEVFDDTDFFRLIGPAWHRGEAADVREIKIEVLEKHRNRNGSAHGGLLMTLADRLMGDIARSASGAPFVVTVQSGFQFLSSARLGDVIVARGKVHRTTRSLVFVSAELHCNNDVILTCSGVFKAMKKAVA